MNRGAKLFLAVGGAVVVGGILILATSKKASAATPEVKPPLPIDEDSAVPETPGEGVVVVPDTDEEEPSSPPAIVPQPEAGFPRDTPHSVPGVQDAAEMARILLRWWSAEGQDLAEADLPNLPALQAQGMPRDWGSAPGDLGDVWGERQKWIAATFRVLSGFTAGPVTPSKGELTDELVRMLKRWAASQALEPFTPEASPEGETQPVVVKAPVPSDVVVVPDEEPAAPATPAPVVPVAEPLPPVVPVAEPLPPAIEKLPELPEVPPTPPAETPVVLQPAPVPDDTARLVAALLADEATDKWKKISPAVQAWQKSRGLVVDGKFGPKSALVVASEIGTVPLVRYWPSGSFKEGRWLPDYQAALLTLAAAAPEPRASQLRLSAAREQGQGFGSKQKALPLSEQIQLAKVA